MNSLEPPDDRIAAALRTVPTPAAPPGLERRAWQAIRRRRARRVALAAAPVAVLVLAVLLWRPWGTAPEVRSPEPVAAREIPPEDLAVLFAPPPVDGLTVLAHRNDASVAVLRRMEGVK